MDEDYDRHVQAVQLLKEAETLFNLCEFSSMGAPLKSSLVIDADLGRTWELMGMFKLSEPDLEGARECFLRAVSSRGLQQDASLALQVLGTEGADHGWSEIETVRTMVALGEVFLSNARWRPALICFTTVGPMLKPGWRLHSIMGLIHREIGNLEPSLAEYDRAVSMEGSPLEVLHDKAVVLMKLGRLDEAEEVLRGFLARREGPAQVWHNLGTVMEAKGENARAMEAYERALELDENYYPSLYSKGRVLQKSGRMEEGKELLQRALDMEGRVYDLSDVTGAKERTDDGMIHMKEIMKGRKEEDK
ncbi:MAG: tetratricopeptide repeat protein [Thermoplasmatota archaeon]